MVRKTHPMLHSRVLQHDESIPFELNHIHDRMSWSWHYSRGVIRTTNKWVCDLSQKIHLPPAQNITCILSSPWPKKCDPNHTCCQCCNAVLFILLVLLILLMLCVVWLGWMHVDIFCWCYEEKDKSKGGEGREVSECDGGGGEQCGIRMVFVVVVGGGGGVWWCVLLERGEKSEMRVVMVEMIINKAHHPLVVPIMHIPTFCSLIKDHARTIWIWPNHVHVSWWFMLLLLEVIW